MPELMGYAGAETEAATSSDLEAVVREMQSEMRRHRDEILQAMAEYDAKHSRGMLGWFTAVLSALAVAVALILGLN